ncbi:uncharacterized protein LOC126835959 [Adelges cooleyi]|uniref:uncharacterized protein LOC126835959 n=1 Tax=Adelges cooleyi TaxID=133065 RepID=UPI00217F939D|nr:uncharacterized protein LOC126835959 [Adelges cooleyi]
MAIELIPWSKGGGGFATAAEFLLTMIDILPEGNGLNQNQIKELIKLYTSSITKSGSIDPLKVNKIFNGIGMPIEPREELFESNRPAAIELMELMIVTAERSTTVHENEIVLSTQEVRTLVAGFKRYNTDNDGLLYKDEAKEFLEELLPNHPLASTLTLLP